MPHNHGHGLTAGDGDVESLGLAEEADAQVRRGSAPDPQSRLRQYQRHDDARHLAPLKVVDGPTVNGAQASFAQDAAELEDLRPEGRHHADFPRGEMAALQDGQHEVLHRLALLRVVPARRAHVVPLLAEDAKP